MVLSFAATIHLRRWCVSKCNAVEIRQTIPHVASSRKILVASRCACVSRVGIHFGGCIDCPKRIPEVMNDRNREPLKKVYILVPVLRSQSQGCDPGCTRVLQIETRQLGLYRRVPEVGAVQHLCRALLLYLGQHIAYPASVLLGLCIGSSHCKSM